MSPVRPNTGSSNFVFSSLTDVQEYFAHQRQKAQERANAYKYGAGGRMSQRDREKIIAEAQAEARVYDDCWAMIGCIDVEHAYHNAGRIPDNICQVCGEEQPARPVYCEFQRTFDNGDQPNVTVECENVATFRVAYEGTPDGGTLVCHQHLGDIVTEYDGALVTTVASDLKK